MQAGTGSLAKGGTERLDGVQRLRRIAAELITAEIGPGRRVEDALDRLAESWNPVIDETARRNLVTDVQALVTDYVRPIRRSLALTPPSHERISLLARQLSESKPLGRISKKEPLRRYLLLCILAQLSSP